MTTHFAIGNGAAIRGQAAKGERPWTLRWHWNATIRLNNTMQSLKKSTGVSASAFQAFVRLVIFAASLCFYTDFAHARLTHNDIDWCKQISPTSSNRASSNS